jgi:hypothetical protein
MDELLSLAEIHKRFASEWVLLGDPETDNNLEVQSGKVLYHSPDREAVYRKAVELHPRRFAVVFTGTIPEGTAVLL